jgi:putative ABC transport system permease protein
MNIIKFMRSKHIQLLFLIFFMLSTLSSFLWVLSDALKSNFNFTASEVLGADGSLESNQPIPNDIYHLAKPYPIKFSETINFTSMAIAEKQSTLVHVRAIENTYPLKGEVKIKINNQILTQVKLGPNQIWIDEALKTRLGVNFSDSIQLGQHVFQVSGIILSEPARAGMANMLAPKIMIRMNDLKKTELIQPYSRVLYQLFIEAEDKSFDDFKQKVKKSYPGLKMYSTKEGRPFANSIFNMAERYLGIFIVVTVLLSGVGMLALSKAYAADMLPMIALLRTFGSSTKKIRSIYFYGFLFFGIGAIFLALALALSGVIVLHAYYPEYIYVSARSIMSLSFLKVASIQLMTSLVILFGFGFAPIIQALKISPLYLFRKEVNYFSAWPSYLSATVAVLFLLVAYLKDYTDVLMLFSYLLIFSVIIYFLFYSVLGLARLMPMNITSVLIQSRKQENTVLITNFSVLFLLSGLLWAIFNDYFANWLNSIPNDAPNQFMINITDNNKNEIIAYWKKQGINLQLSPMLTARLKSVNNEPRSYFRPLNLSYMNLLPEDNTIILGKKWDTHLSGESVITIEQNFAKNIQANVGDVLVFNIAGQEVSGKILNIRNLKWESFKPNFFVIFPEGVLESFPKTYITSLYLPANQLIKTTEFLKQFPGVSLIDIKLSLDQVKTVLIKVISGLKYLMFVLFVLAFLVYYAMLSIRFYERQYENALLRSMGSSQGLLRKIICIEYGLIGLLSGGFGMVGGIILAILLSKRLSISYDPTWMGIVIGAGLGSVLTMLIGGLTTYKVANTSPLILLKEEI